MIAYIFYKPSNIINGIINNVTYVDDNSDNDGRIDGDGESCIFGLGSDYIILQNPIELSVGDVIDIAGLEDERDYFLKSKEEWFREKQARLDQKVKEQQEQLERLLQLLEGKEE